MQLESIEGLSRKSRGILYNLKNNLNRRKQTLIEHVCKIFGFQKHEYNKKQFARIIKKYDANLILSDLDELFDGLDESHNGKVFFYKLKQAFQGITQTDNPTAVISSRIIKTASKNNRHNIIDIVDIYTEVRKLMLSSEDILEVLHLFGQQNDGIISTSNITDILNNIEYNNNTRRNIFMKSMFQQKDSMTLQLFLQKLDMNELARRSTIKMDHSHDKISEIKSEINQSQFIKDMRKKQNKLDQSMSMSYSINHSKISVSAEPNSQYFELENIPSSLQHYFNYGSELEQGFGHMAAQYLNNNLIFIDSQNPPYSQAYQWIHLAQTNRHYFLFQMAKSVLVRQKNRKGLGQLLQPKDIIQGTLGDCYFLSAVAGVVEKYPQLVYRLFVLEKNPSHLYGVRLFIEGLWRTIVLDACFPISRNGSFCGAQPHHQEIWVMLLQKAWAKVYGTYDNIHAGYNQEGLNAITGAPSIYVSAKENQFLKRVEVELKKGSILSCATSTYVGQFSKADQQKMGLFSHHAYSLLDVHFGLRDKNNHEITLFKIRNPWGRKGWQGRWSFRSDLWTRQLRQILQYTSDPHDGSFFMCLQDFMQYFDHINICKINLAYKNSWLEVEADRDQFKAVRMKVAMAGDYHFTLYQENPRRYSGKPYQKSRSWMFLLEEKDGKVRAVGSCSKDKRDNTMEVTLQKGEYLLISKVQWRLWERHKYCVSSYGPQKIKMKPCPQFNQHMLSDYIENKAKLGFGKKSFYDNSNILKRIHFSPEEGYGFILINNQENVIFQLTIYLDKCHGITILQPYSLPIQLQIFPGEEIICKFLVSPTGYSYSLRETYGYLNSA